MVGYFVRRLLGAVLLGLGGSLVVYSLLVYLPGGARNTFDPPYGDFADLRRVKILEDLWYEHWDLTKPWPLNYVAWMFDPADTQEVLYPDLLSGADGTSDEHDQLMRLVLQSGMVMILMLTAVAAIQRRRGPPAYRTLAPSTAELRDRTLLSGMRPGV